MKNLRYTFLAALVLVALSSISLAQDATQPIVTEGERRLQENQAAQQTVDTIHGDTRNIVDEYENLLKLVDSLKVYNRILEQQLAGQERELATLQDTIANAAIIQRQVLPLLTRMLDGLEDFIRLDTPFLHAERTDRVENLRRLILRPDLSNAEKTRRVFEAFQIEAEYGDTIESYKGTLDIADKTFDVDFLRVGRIALMYRSVGSENYGYWDKNQQAWDPVSSSNYKRNIDKGLKMARQEMAPELLTIPVANIEETVQ